MIQIWNISWKFRTFHLHKTELLVVYFLHLYNAHLSLCLIIGKSLTISGDHQFNTKISLLCFIKHDKWSVYPTLTCEFNPPIHLKPLVSTVHRAFTPLFWKKYSMLTIFGSMTIWFHHFGAEVSALRHFGSMKF